MLDELSARTRIPKQVLLREALDDLLDKHGVIGEGLTTIGRALILAREAHDFANYLAPYLVGTVQKSRARSLMKNAKAGAEIFQAYQEGRLERPKRPR